MITARDRLRMDRDVEAIISDWSTNIEIWDMAPAEQQPQWNPIMHEVTGDPVYNKQVNVPAEVRDHPRTGLSTNMGGAKYNGSITLCISDAYVVREDSLVILDGMTNDPWRVKSIRSRLGEHIVDIIRIVGDEE